MPVRLWEFIMSSRWVIVIPSVVKMALTSSSGSTIPPDLTPDAAAASPSAPAASGFPTIMSAVLLKYWCAVRFASVYPSKGSFHDPCKITSPDLCHDFLPGFCHTFSPDLCRALFLDF